MTHHILIKTKHSTTVHALENDDIVEIMLPSPNAIEAELIVTLHCEPGFINVQVNDD